MKNRYTPANPIFTIYIKVGLNGIFVAWTCYPDEFNLSISGHLVLSLHHYNAITYRYRSVMIRAGRQLWYTLRAATVSGYLQILSLVIVTARVGTADRLTQNYRVFTRTHCTRSWLPYCVFLKIEKKG